MVEYVNPAGGIDDTSGLPGGVYAQPQGGMLAAEAPLVEVALTGIQAGVQFGSLGVSVSVPLTGMQIGVRFGRIAGPSTMYSMAWANVPAWLLRTLPAYLYIQYNDDDDLQAFFEAQNTLQQDVLDWLTTVLLPIYTGPLITGDLLDWVAAGLYGQERPTLPSGFNANLGPYNTWMFNQLEFNQALTIEPTDLFVTTDDIFKRIITWNFYKGDGRTFSVRWLKRRVMRFLLGTDGTDPGIGETYRVSVGIVGSHVDIRILSGLRTYASGAMFNTSMFNMAMFNQASTDFVAYDPLEFAPALKAAVQGGALQLPFQFDYTVTV